MKNPNGVDWKKLWSYLAFEHTGDGDIEVDISELEMAALQEFASFLAKMNPPEDPAIPLDARIENDVKFRAFLKTQFGELTR